MSMDPPIRPFILVLALLLGTIKQLGHAQPGPPIGAPAAAVSASASLPAAPASLPTLATLTAADRPAIPTPSIPSTSTNESSTCNVVVKLSSSWQTHGKNGTLVSMDFDLTNPGPVPVLVPWSLVVTGSDYSDVQQVCYVHPEFSNSPI